MHLRLPKHPEGIMMQLWYKKAHFNFSHVVHLTAPSAHSFQEIQNFWWILLNFASILSILKWVPNHQICRSLVGKNLFGKRALPASRSGENADKLMFYLSIQSNINFTGAILLMQKILHQLIGTLSHYLPGLIDPRWCRISSITSIMSCFFKPSSFNNLRFSSQFFNTHRFVDSTSMSFSVSAKILETKKFLEDWVVVSNIFYFHPETWGIFSPNVIFFRWVCLNSTTNQKTSNYPDHALGFCLGSPTQRCESPVNHWSRGEGAWDPKSSTLIFVKKKQRVIGKRCWGRISTWNFRSRYLKL